jgi:8-oxo-dGTP pyrophosphatase MutT (NUDIX family)
VRGPVRAAGGVVYSYGPDGVLCILVISDRHGARTLPKGHLEPGESDEQAAVREIAEETGIVCTLERPLARTRYPVQKKGFWRDKEVAYFLARAPYAPPTPALAEGITAVEWLPAEAALNSLTYAQVREVLRKALSLLGA